MLADSYAAVSEIDVVSGTRHAPAGPIAAENVVLVVEVVVQVFAIKIHRTLRVVLPIVGDAEVVGGAVGHGRGNALLGLGAACGSGMGCIWANPGQPQSGGCSQGFDNISPGGAAVGGIHIQIQFISLSPASTQCWRDSSIMCFFRVVLADQRWICSRRAARFDAFWLLSRSGSGTAPTSSRVYGCRGLSSSCTDSPDSTIRPSLSTAIRSER